MGNRGHLKRNIGKVAHLNEQSSQLFLAVNSSLFKLYWEGAQLIWFSMKVKVEHSFQWWEKNSFRLSNDYQCNLL